MLSADHTRASVIFSVGEMSLVDRRAVINDIAVNADPPPGVTLMAGGLAVIGAETTNALSQNRGLMTIAALGAICLGLFAIYRNPAKAVLPLVPIVLALSASSVVLYVLGIELNPLTSVSGPLIIAMGTEFTVLLMSRYFEEREKGAPPRVAMDIASANQARDCRFGADGHRRVPGLVFSNFPLIRLRRGHGARHGALPAGDAGRPCRRCWSGSTRRTGLVAAESSSGRCNSVGVEDDAASGARYRKLLLRRAFSASTDSSGAPSTIADVLPGRILIIPSRTSASIVLHPLSLIMAGGRTVQLLHPKPKPTGEEKS
jgi:hypothetical protein